MTLSDADIADDQANYVMTEYEQGRQGDNVIAEAEYECGCAAQKVETAAGWQWVQAEACDDLAHKGRA